MRLIKKRKRWPLHVRDFTDQDLVSYIRIQNDHLTGLLKMVSKYQYPPSPNAEMGIQALAQKITEAEDELDTRYRQAKMRKN